MERRSDEDHRRVARCSPHRSLFHVHVRLDKPVDRASRTGDPGYTLYLSVWKHRAVLCCLQGSEDYGIDALLRAKREIQRATLDKFPPIRRAFRSGLS